MTWFAIVSVLLRLATINSSPFSFTTPVDELETVVGVCAAILGCGRFRSMYVVKPDDLNLDRSLIRLHQNYSMAISTFSNVPVNEAKRLSECSPMKYEKTRDLVLVLYPTKSVLVNLFYHGLSVPTTSYIFMSSKTLDLEDAIKTAWKLKYIYKVLVVDVVTKIAYRFDPFLTCGQGSSFQPMSIWDYTKLAHSLCGYIKDINGCPLVISMYPREETAVLLQNSTFTGQDGKMINLLKEKMNCTPVVKLMKGKMTYGYKRINDTYSGTFANLIYGTSDVSLNGHFMKDYKCDTVELTRQVTCDQVCLMTPKAEVIPSIFAVLKSFQHEVWAMIAIAYFLVCLAFYWWAVVSAKYMNQKAAKGCILGLEIFRIMIASPSHKKFGRYSEKILFAFCWFFSTVILNSFQGSLVTFLNTPMYYPDIETFDDLIASGLPLRTSSLSFRDLLLSDPNLSVLAKKLYFSKNISKMEHFYGEFAGFQRINVYNMKYYKDIKFTADNGENYKMLHTMKQCLTSYFISYAFPKNSPFKKRINEIISAVDYGGFIVKWNSDSAKYIFKKYHLATVESKNTKVFSLRDLEVAFFVFIAGLALSAVAFSLERAFYRVSCKNRKVIKPGKVN